MAGKKASSKQNKSVSKSKLPDLVGWLGRLKVWQQAVTFGLVLAIVGVGSYSAYQTYAAGPTYTVPPSLTYCKSANSVLRYGEYNSSCVRTWQAFMRDGRQTRSDCPRISSGYLTSTGTNLSVDGDFGPTTQAYTRCWQSQFGLDADGVVGPITYGRSILTCRANSQIYTTSIAYYRIAGC